MEGKVAFDKQEARYVYVLIREDLTPAQQGVQAVHAAMSAIHKYGGLTEDTRLAMLSVRDAKALEGWLEKLGRRGVPHQAFFEPDHGIGWSSAATAPISAEQGKIFRSLRLWDPSRLSVSAPAAHPTKDAEQEVAVAPL